MLDFLLEKYVKFWHDKFFVINEMFSDMNVGYSKMFHDNPTSRPYENYNKPLQVECYIF